jgi:hypothetical protein
MEGQAPDVRHDPSALRISDADRHRVTEVLREAAGEGRLELDELEERIEATYRANTNADLVPITAALPVSRSHPAAVARPTAPAGPRYDKSIAVMSETRRGGPWQLYDGHTAVAVMGSVTLDLREARLAAREVTITATAVMGEVKVVVGAETTVVVEGVGIMGEFSEQRPRTEARPTPDSPVVRVKGVALMGSVHVQRRGPSRDMRRRLERGR